MKISIRNLLATILLTLTVVSTQAQDCLSLYFEANTVDDEVVVQVKVDNFKNILISQFAFTYSFQNLDLISVEGNSDINLNATHIFSDIPGYVSVSWSNASIGQTLADGSTLLELKFSEAVVDIAKFAVDPNFKIEIIDAFFEEVCFLSTPLTINEPRTQLIGNVYHDLNDNCLKDETDLPLSGWTLLVDDGFNKFYRVTDAFGHYQIPVELGNYTIEVLPKSDLWSPCSGPLPIAVTNNGEILENSFIISPENSSSALEVVVSSSDVIKCEDNVFSISYKNNGTGVAQAAEITFLFDQYLSYVSTNTGNFSIVNQTITFELGNVKPGEGDEFQVILFASCDNIDAGQTICTEAEISSADVDFLPDVWNGAVLTTRATCEGDSVAFAIRNIGNAPMTSAFQSIVVEDDVMFGINEVELDPQEAITFKHAASGGVYRVLVDQEDGYPLGNFSTDFVEFCNGGGTETYQYVSMFQNEDESPYRDIECVIVRDAVLANYMTTYPVGYREDHMINQNEDIEYTINFQNTGSDTVFNMYILNELDESLNVETLIPGPSSHDYTLSIEEDRRLRIELSNIQLPGANDSALESKGFVKFRISQNPNVALGTQIRSSSLLFFDDQNGIATDEVFHTVGEEFIEIILSNEDLLSDEELIVVPNPATSSIRVELPEDVNNVSYIIYDNKGSVVSAANALSNAFYISRDFIESGMYFLEIRSSTKVIGVKKIVFLD